MEIFRGILIVFAIAIVAGAIAYIGDRVGHQVGRRRMTLFNLRPKYTSTIVAVATGMLIAISVTSIAIISSQSVQTAFFRMGSLNARINELQAQSDALENKTRNGTLVIGRGTTINQQFVVLAPNSSRDVQLSKLSAYFGQTVKYANAVFTQNPYNLRPYPLNASDPSVIAKLKAQVDEDAVRRNLSNSIPVLILAVTPENLYRGDQIVFAFANVQDKFVFANRQLVATLDYPGGTIPDLNRLLTNAVIIAQNLGMPSAFTQYPTFDSRADYQHVVETVTRGRGIFRVALLSAVETYPHNGQLVFHITVEKTAAR